MYTSGRRRKIAPKNEGHEEKVTSVPPRAVSAVAAVGAVVCVLFFCAAVSDRPDTPAYPVARSEAAVATFLAEHTAFADAIGLNTYFSKDAVQVGAFSSRGEQVYRDFVADSTEEWTFGAYLRDAFRTLLGIQ